MLRYIKVLFVLISSVWYFGNVFAITVEVPMKGTSEDIIITGPTNINSDEATIFEIIQTINKYLWLSVGLSSMIALVIGGFKLITAEGNAAAVDKANSILVGSVVGILIAIFSYSVVRIVINLLT